jgi:protein-tyrosine phosphatase
VLGAILAALPFWLGGWSWLLAWAGLSFLVVGIAYVAGADRIFGKRPSGELGVAAYALGPFVVLTWLSWRLTIMVSREHPHDAVRPELLLARRLRPHEVPDHVDVIVDLTAEFREPAAVIGARTYHNLRALDAGVPRHGELDALLATLPADKTLLVHCAQGHGRTAVFAACWLVHHGHAADADTAIAACVAARPGVNLSPVQRAFVREFVARRGDTIAR